MEPIFQRGRDRTFLVPSSYGTLPAEPAAAARTVPPRDKKRPPGRISPHRWECCAECGLGSQCHDSDQIADHVRTLAEGADIEPDVAAGPPTPRENREQPWPLHMRLKLRGILAACCTRSSGASTRRISSAAAAPTSMCGPLHRSARVESTRTRTRSTLSCSRWAASPKAGAFWRTRWVLERRSRPALSSLSFAQKENAVF